MFALMIVCNLLLVFVSLLNAKPVEVVLLNAQDLDGEESHPYQIVVKPPSGIEMPNNEAVAESAPLRVIAVYPAQDARIISEQNDDLMPAASDLHAAETYGHGHHGSDNHGWLDMGAYSHGKGAFGWYADYPVGHHGR